MYKWPGIPEPTTDPAALLETVKALKEAIEMMTGTRGNPDKYSVDKRLTQLDNRVESGDSVLQASLLHLQETTANEIEAVATDLLELDAEVITARGDQPNLSAQLTHLQQVRVDREEAIAKDVSTLTSEVTGARQGKDNLSANLIAMRQTFADADTAIASDVTNLETEIVNARDGKTNLRAKLNAMSIAQVDGDDAVAEFATEVQAEALKGTAQGKMSLVARSGISGASAAYGWQLRAGSKWVGMTAIVNTAGEASVVFDLNTFKLRDNVGAPRDVFTYSAGKFKLTGDVAIDGSLMVNGTMVGDALMANAITRVFQEDTFDALGVMTPITFNARAGAKLIVLITASGAGGPCTVKDNFGNEMGVGITSAISGISELNDGTKVYSYSSPAATGHDVWTALSTANRTITARIPSGASAQVTIIECAR